MISRSAADWESSHHRTRRSYNVANLYNENVIASVILDGIGRPEADNVIDSIWVGSAKLHTAVAAGSAAPSADRPINIIRFRDLRPASTRPNLPRRAMVRPHCFPPV
jgi:hypothetical protein